MSEKYVICGKIGSIDLYEGHPTFKSRVLLQDRDRGMVTLYIDTAPIDTPFKVSDSIRCDAGNIGGSEWFARTEEISKSIPISQSIQFPPQAGEDKILIDRIVDGDTVAFYFLVPDRGRIVGYDSPESRGESREKGLAAKEHLKTLLPEGSVQTVKLCGKDKYGRILLEFPSIKDRMLQDGHGKEWDGIGGHPK